MVLTIGREQDPAKRIRSRQGKLIRQYRELRELSQEALGQLLDPPVTGAAVSEWERGASSPRQHLQVALAKALNVPWSALFGLDGEAA